MSLRLIVLTMTLSVSWQLSAEPDSTYKDQRLIVALMHYAPITGDMQQNTQSMLKAMTLAKKKGADWFVTPELGLTGYYFHDAVGTEWLVEDDDPYKKAILQHAKQLKLYTFLSHIEHSENKFYNTVFVANRQGMVTAKHRKINVIPGSEGWSTPGNEPAIANLGEYKIGLLICADAWPSEHAKKLKKLGVDVVISPANWGPGKYGPGSTWANRSRELGVPLVVNNRTGIDKALDMRQAKTVVAENGKHSFEFYSPENALILLEFMRSDNALEYTGSSEILHF